MVTLYHRPFAVVPLLRGNSDALKQSHLRNFSAYTIKISDALSKKLYFFLFEELSTRYEFTQESSSSAKQEVDQLREEVKVLSAQLLRQHNVSLESQVTFEHHIPG